MSAFEHKPTPVEEHEPRGGSDWTDDAPPLAELVELASRALETPPPAHEMIPGLFGVEPPPDMSTLLPDRVPADGRVAAPATKTPLSEGASSVELASTNMNAAKSTILGVNKLAKGIVEGDAAAAVGGGLSAASGAFSLTKGTLTGPASSAVSIAGSGLSLVQNGLDVVEHAGDVHLETLDLEEALDPESSAFKLGKSGLDGLTDLADIADTAVKLRGRDVPMIGKIGTGLGVASGGMGLYEGIRTIAGGDDRKEDNRRGATNTGRGAVQAMQGITSMLGAIPGPVGSVSKAANVGLELGDAWRDMNDEVAFSTGYYRDAEGRRQSATDQAVDDGMAFVSWLGLEDPHHESSLDEIAGGAAAAGAALYRNGETTVRSLGTAVDYLVDDDTEERVAELEAQGRRDEAHFLDAQLGKNGDEDAGLKYLHLQETRARARDDRAFALPGGRELPSRATGQEIANSVEHGTGGEIHGYRLDPARRRELDQRGRRQYEIDRLEGELDEIDVLDPSARIELMREIAQRRTAHERASAKEDAAHARRQAADGAPQAPRIDAIQHAVGHYAE